MKDLGGILSRYGVEKADKIIRMSGGLINDTYYVEAGENKAVLQKLNSIFKKEVQLDLAAVSTHLENKGMRAQKILLAKSGDLFVEEAGEIWRLFSFIPGKVFTKADSQDIVYEAGKILGNFHLAVCDLNYKFQHIRTMHHATEVFYEKFQKIASNTADNDFKRLSSGMPDIRKFYLPANLRKNVTHGDPKLSNIVFSEPTPSNFKAEALIDLDDCGRGHSVLIELGDGFRSWCGTGEDEAGNFFDIEKFKAGLKGYLEGSRNFLKKEELELLPRAIKLITLELASRFLIDYEEGSYFGWDSVRYASRKEHNLTRAKGQIALFSDLEAKSKKMDAIIKSI